MKENIQVTISFAELNIILAISIIGIGSITVRISNGTMHIYSSETWFISCMLIVVLLHPPGAPMGTLCTLGGWVHMGFILCL